MAPKKPVDPDEIMIVNDSPGEECRIAILQNGHLEELFTERTATATNVGNIYKGKVTNVEPAIQAAFVDYGEGQNGFLHISDLHPKYFPGEERTERVGKKIPRRDRPPIQAALRRGQEILVQVLKEGIGTKGPTLTSYLSIPGRLLVLMPDMDRVGVSRKVEDEAKRREMREILDSLNLPDGFGFILRTAGYGKTKTELKRDAAYLLRLWKMMEKRIKTVNPPCELYTESDLLIRSVRDVLRPSIKCIVVDSESAAERAEMFLRVVSPRSAPKVIRYRRAAPIFHAFDIERQIELIHAHEVPLPSGGRLVIDQTEALVAIDVNSGKSRSARDSETNAYETDVEAADEICRQLRLRDLGGLIVNDLIDMRSMKHRKLIEERFANNLKRDRAKATALPISDFGILEMTRQRMRPSIRKSHFMDCPHCSGHGEIKVPEYVASDAARHVGFLLQYDRVHRVELVCSPRVASVLLSAKRRELVRMEDASGKRIDVRVSDAITVDRVDYYAYDDRNADIDIAQLPVLIAPSLEALEAEQLVGPSQEIEAEGEEAPVGKKRRAGRNDVAAIALAGDFGDDFDDFEEEEEEESEEQSTSPATASELPATLDGEQGAPDEGARRGRRRRRRKRGGKGAAQQPMTGVTADQTPQPELQGTFDNPPIELQPVGDGMVAATNGEVGVPGKRSRRRRGRRKGRGGDHNPNQVNAQPGINSASPNESDDQFSSAARDGDPSTEQELPMRIHELAKELSVTSRELMDRCEPESNIHPMSNHMQTVSADEAQSIRNLFTDGASQAHSDQTSETSMRDGNTLQGPGQGGTGGGKRPRRRRGRRGRGGKGAPLAAGVGEGAQSATISLENTSPDSNPEIADVVETSGVPMPGHGKKKRRPRRRKRGKGGPSQESQNQDRQHMHAPHSSTPSNQQHQHPPKATNESSGGSASGAPAKKPRRALYRAGRVAVSPKAREGSANADD